MALFENTFPPYVPFGSRTLSGGETGTDVAVLQTIFDEMLKVMNPPQGPMGPSIPVTGTYDTATVAAVRNVQAYFGLSVDGVAGAATYFAFGQGVGSLVTYGGPRYGSRTLSQGSTGGDVTVLQNRLNLYRYSTILGAPADGVFGPKTASAVLAFKADAVANGQTGLANNAVVGDGTFDATWIYTYAGGRGLFTGRNGFDVAFIQTLLQGLGFYSGPIHGYYDAPTQRAVVAFQTSAGITADGTVGQATFHAFGLRNQVAAPLPLPVPPITPVPPTTVYCCFTLQPTSGATGTNEGVFFIHNGPSTGPSSQALEWIASVLLPPPSTYGSQFTQYGYGLNSTTTFSPLTQCPVQTAGLGLWTAFFVTSSAGPLTQASVAIAPLTAAGAAGPIVARGSGTCPATSGASTP